MPAFIDLDRMEEKQVVRFRVGNVYRDAALTVAFDGNVVSRRKKRVMAPGEMEQVVLKREDLERAGNLGEIILSIEEQQNLS